MQSSPAAERNRPNGRMLKEPVATALRKNAEEQAPPHLWTELSVAIPVHSEEHCSPRDHLGLDILALAGSKANHVIDEIRESGIGLRVIPPNQLPPSFDALSYARIHN